MFSNLLDRDIDSGSPLLTLITGGVASSIVSNDALLLNFGKNDLLEALGDFLLLYPLLAAPVMVLGAALL